MENDGKLLTEIDPNTESASGVVPGEISEPLKSDTDIGMTLTSPSTSS